MHRPKVSTAVHRPKNSTASGKNSTSALAMLAAFCISACSLNDPQDDQDDDDGLYDDDSAHSTVPVTCL